MTDEKLRYPLGRFEPRGRLDPEAREAALDTLASLAGRLEQAVDGLSDAQLDTPYRPGGWTVRQVVHHVADSHLNSYARFRWALTEDEPEIRAYDEKAWAELDDARTGPVELSLGLVAAIERRRVRLLRGLDEGAWRTPFRHPERPGEVLDLDFLLDLYQWHARHHVAHVERLREREGW